MENSSYFDLSGFYLDLWALLDWYFAETNWIVTDPHPLTSEQQMQRLTRDYATLRRDLEDTLLIGQITSDYNRVMHLQDTYPLNGHSKQAWLNEARQVRDYVQTLGLRYAELAAEEA
ncbi:MAG: hypothetical protein SF029_09950 [bacterium]|nr:hypothetical protein [bacterium]